MGHRDIETTMLHSRGSISQEDALFGSFDALGPTGRRTNTDCARVKRCGPVTPPPAPRRQPEGGVLQRPALRDRVIVPSATPSILRSKQHFCVGALAVSRPKEVLGYRLRPTLAYTPAPTELEAEFFHKSLRIQLNSASLSWSPSQCRLIGQPGSAG